METRPLAEIRQDLSRYVEEAVSTHARFDITRNGKRAAVLLSADDYDSLVETLDILADADVVKAIEEGLADARAGRTYDLDEVVVDLVADGKIPPR